MPEFIKKKKPPPEKHPMPPWLNFLLGGTAGTMSICVVQPADLTKTRMQLATKAVASQGTISMVRKIYRNEGVRGFYTGLTAAMFRQATYTTGRLGCFNVLMDYHKKNYGTASYGTKMLLGMLAGGVGAFVGTPAEVALIRMTADGKLPVEKRRNYRHIFNALSRITREEGVLSLWRGTVATCTRAMVVNGAQLGTYAQAREKLMSTFGDGVPLHFVSSMIAGFVTSVASMPVDNVKTRVQVASHGQSQLGILKEVIRKDGVLSLWSGLWPTYAKIGPMTVLTFIFLEQFNALYYRYY